MNDLRHWRDGLVSKGVAPATINRTRAGLRAALELAASLDDRIVNRSAFRSGLKGLPGGKNARRVVLPDADVLRLVEAALSKTIAPSACSIEVLAQTGARISQAARLTCGDLQSDGPDPRLLMPTSYKGRGEKERQHVPVPITANLAALLDELRCDRPRDAPLLLKGDGTRWLATKKSEQWTIFREVAEPAKLDRNRDHYLRPATSPDLLLIAQGRAGLSLWRGCTMVPAAMRSRPIMRCNPRVVVTCSRARVCRTPKALTAENVVTLPGAVGGGKNALPRLPPWTVTTSQRRDGPHLQKHGVDHGQEG